ncbi:MAG: peptide chain release factor N(5)-glutamine methyltransferase [Chitinophagaceae bacterium]
MNLQQALSHITNQLSLLYEHRECLSIANLVLEDVTMFSKTQRLIKKDDALNEVQIKKIESYIAKLLKHQPVQQVLGYTWFAGNRFIVDENVLIPRPETDELVAAIALENKNKIISILDIGTGSGCIAISLKKILPNASVTAIDVSVSALEIAKKNATSIGVDIEIKKMDFLDKNNWSSFPKFDIIVSNPPYIKENEKQYMNDNVLLHEPHLALFVPNDNALLFYNAIAALAKTNLKQNGTIWVEINEALGQETAQVFTEKGFTVIIKKDMQGKDRMVKAFNKEVLS